ncbi:MAG: glycogen/starch/alpha-glucan phosphorylase, partial [Clostridia bacterium]|nr:glycogen/starch/alpha-glucan phosphorylase [Clostridia bacterium]
TACGADNIFIFGLTSKEVDALWARGYNSSEFYVNNKKLIGVLDALNKGFNGQIFSDIIQYLLTGSPIADPYMCLADFGDYCAIHEKADGVYENKKQWAKMSLNNIASAGVFAADRSIKEYAERIWHLKSIK